MARRVVGRGLILRELTIGDYDDMIAMWRKAHLPIRTRGRESRRELRRMMTEFPDLHIGIFETEGRRTRLIGIVIATYEGRKGWINRLAVHPKARRKGLAKLLIKEAESRLRARGAPMFSTLIEDYNEPSMALFKSAGYQRCDDVVYFRKLGDGGC